MTRKQRRIEAHRLTMLARKQAREAPTPPLPIIDPGSPGDPAPVWPATLEGSLRPGIGRPKVDTGNFDAIEQLCALQCTNEELAAFFRCSVSTIEARFREDAAFKEAVEHGRSLGKMSIRRKQFALLEGGSVTMGIWLGKQNLGQRDNVEITGDNKSPLSGIDAYRTLLEERRARRAAEIAAEDDTRG